MSAEPKVEEIDNVIQFPTQEVIQVIEPVRVSREVADLIGNYLDEETNLMDQHFPL
jgi:hypothetical protein